MSIKVRNNLWQVGGMELTDPSDAGIFLVRFGDKAALIDAGSGRGHSKLRKNIAECLESNAQIEYLLLTHCHFDHAGGAKAIRDEYGCKIVAHELDAIYLQTGDNHVTGAAWYGACLEPLTVDIRLQDQESTLSIGNGTVTAIHCPGHSPGSVAYTTEIDGQLILFGQDIHGPLHSELLSNEEQYVNSLTRLLRLQADVLLESHFGVIEPKEEVRAFIEYWRSPLGVSNYAILYAPDDWETRQKEAFPDLEKKDK
ncbi:MBL fold metallo-hydrolase [Desulfomonile tiedjei]|uniref:Zn-dependent hydrolase, glyoxylase n=1 Tax=Desulfomonile tiedjei (strain ATCC 49306 / DSM 6799 / DCB-1) TaxID=706587 RepID=I4C416_DESTA|nr:MBL fold metallo-hydrolase [Desulfomonile tiedjei]AFM24307.1 Zn-dependent hydrolase, glyoxylase [Desulfomonile tiedjei DSM 6799]